MNNARKKYQRSDLSQIDQVVELAKLGPITNVEVAAQIGIGPKAASTLLSRLVCECRLVRLDVGKPGSGPTQYTTAPDKTIAHGPWRKVTNEQLGITL